MADHESDKSGPGKSLDSLLGVFSAVTEGLLPQAKAIVMRDPSCVQRLDEESASPLHVAALHGHTEVLEMLLQYGSDVNEHSCGSLPLHLAAARGHADVVGALLAAGSWRSPREASTANQDTPLHKASRHGHTHVVQLLLAAGASPWRLNARGLTPCAVATHPHCSQQLAAAIACTAQAASKGSVQESADEPMQLPPPAASTPALADVKLQAAAFESAAGKGSGSSSSSKGSGATGSDTASASGAGVHAGAQPVSQQKTQGALDAQTAPPRKVSLFGVLR